MQWYDYMRLATAVLVVWSTLRLTSLVKRDHLTYSSRLIDYIWFVYATFFVMFIGAIESISRDTPYRYSTTLIFIISLVGFRATRDTGTPLQKSEGG